MLERLQKYREPIAWAVLALCVLWAGWRVVVALTAPGPWALIGDHAAAPFTIVQALALFSVAVWLVLPETVPPRVTLFLWAAFGFGVVATAVSVIFLLVGYAAPEPWPGKVIGTIGFVALQFIPTVVVWGLWRLLQGLRADDPDEPTLTGVRHFVTGSLQRGPLGRGDLIEGADEPTRRVSR